MDEIFLTTEDNLKIAGDLYSVENPVLWLVLIHMMPATKESYKELAEKLQGLNYESLAIDLRGHGQSDGGPNSYQNFASEEHQAGIKDLKAAVDFLIKKRSAEKSKIVFIGASIGANLALEYIVKNSEFSAEDKCVSGIKTAILLSAGLNYHGIKAEQLVKQLKPEQKIFFVSAQDDGNVFENYKQTEILYNLMPISLNKKIKIYKTGGHGTDILKNQPDLTDLIINFIK